MLSVIEQAFRIIQIAPGIGSGDLARKLGLPPCSARRAAKALVSEGRVVIAGDWLEGYRYWPGNTANTDTLIPAAPQVLDGRFREVPPAARTPSPGRSLVPSFDSRLDTTLARNRVGAPPFPNRQNGKTSANPFAAALNNLFIGDPSGDETLSALAAAYRENAAVTRAAEVRDARERAAVEHRRRADAQAAETARKAEQVQAERLTALRAVVGLWRREPPEPLVLDRSCDFEATVSDNVNPQMVAVRENAVPKTRASEPKVSVTEPLVSDRVADFFTGARPAARKSFWEKHFAAPLKKSVWR